MTQHVHLRGDVDFIFFSFLNFKLGLSNSYQYIIIALSNSRKQSESLFGLFKRLKHGLAVFWIHLDLYLLSKLILSLDCLLLVIPIKLASDQAGN